MNARQVQVELLSRSDLVMAVLAETASSRRNACFAATEPFRKPIVRAARQINQGLSPTLSAADEESDFM